MGCTMDLPSAGGSSEAGPCGFSNRPRTTEKTGCYLNSPVTSPSQKCLLVNFEREIVTS